ncbi:ankyrin repeat-containing domain protein [Neocallimastix sp. 'constans']
MKFNTEFSTSFILKLKFLKTLSSLSQLDQTQKSIDEIKMVPKRFKNILNGQTFKDGRDNIIKYFMQLGYERENPAFYACEFNKVDILEYLIKENIIEETPIFTACRGGNKNIFNYLVNHGTNIDQRNSRGESLVFVFVKNEADINVKRKSKSFMFPSCRIANINQIGLNRYTPIFYACEIDKKNMDQYFVEHGANIIYKHQLLKLLILTQRICFKKPFCLMLVKTANKKFLKEHQKGYKEFKQQRFQQIFNVIESLSILLRMKLISVC